jgi:hypothetical protein
LIIKRLQQSCFVGIELADKPGEGFGGRSPMKTVAGDLVKSKSTGEFYKVKKIKEPIYLLEAEDVPSKLWLGNKESLELLYDRVENQEEQSPNSAA